MWHHRGLRHSTTKVCLNGSQPLQTYSPHGYVWLSPHARSRKYSWEFKLTSMYNTIFIRDYVVKMCWFEDHVYILTLISNSINYFSLNQCSTYYCSLTNRPRLGGIKQFTVLTDSVGQILKKDAAWLSCLFDVMFLASVEKTQRLAPSAPW